MSVGIVIEGHPLNCIGQLLERFIKKQIQVVTESHHLNL